MQSKLLILITILSSFAFTPQAFACSRDLTPLFFLSPVITKVSGDCSVIGYDVNPYGVIFDSIIVGLVTIFVLKKPWK